MRQVHVLRTLNRMHEVIPGGHVKGRVLIDGDDLYGPGVDPVLVRRPRGHGVPAPQPVPTMSIRENVLAGARLNNKRLSKSDGDALVEKSLQGANHWNEVKDRLDKPGGRPLVRSSAASVHRPRDRRVARRAADGRAVLGARPHLDFAIEELISELKNEYTDRDRHAQHAAGLAR